MALRFCTPRFPTHPEGDLEWGNGQPGSAVVNWIRGIMAEIGYATWEPIQEDYGWGCWVKVDRTIWIAVSFAGDHSEGQPEWVLSASHEIPLFSLGEWFRRAEGRGLAEQIETMLRLAIHTQPEIRLLNDD